MANSTLTDPQRDRRRVADGVGGGHQPRPGCGRRGRAALHSPASRLGVPAGPELKGFERISLDAGETCTARFTLGPELRYWNAAARDWVQDASTFDVWVGGSSAAELGTTSPVTS